MTGSQKTSRSTGEFGWLAVLAALLLAWMGTVLAAGAESAPTAARAVVNFSTLAGGSATAQAGNLDRGRPGNRNRVAASPLPSATFQGLADNQTSIPPDTHGAVGTNYLMAVANGSVQIQTRSGSVVSYVTLSDFWQSVFTNNITDVFDPKVLYDETRDRFVLTACYSRFDTNSSVLIGASATGDPTGNWFLYRVTADATGVTWADYPSIGFNSNWVVVSMNMFDNVNGPFVAAHVYIFDKANLYGGGAVANNTLFVSPDPQAFTLAPVVNHDDTTEMYLIENRGGQSFGNAGALRLYSITGRVGTETVNPRGTIVVPQGWSDTPIVGNADFAPQLGSPIRIMNNDARMQNALLRNGSLWCAQTIFLPPGGGTRSAAQWFQINPRGGGTVQRGRIDDPFGQVFHAFPSIGVNRNNDVLVGYSTFSTNQYASANYSYRLATDPLNTMQPSTLLKAGEGPYYKTYSGTRNRWGDYSMTVPDPLNGLDLWTIQEFAAAPAGDPSVNDSGRWGTWWGRVSGPTAADGVLEVTVNPPSGSVLQGGTQLAISVTVNDSVAITNAVVRGTFGVLTNVIFPNDGLVPDLAAGDNVYTLNVAVPNLLSNVMDLTIEVSAPGKLDAVLAVSYVVQSPPPNDLFDNGIRIPDGGGVVAGNNTFATFEGPGEPQHAGVFSATNSVWWYWSPTNTGLVLVDTLGSAFNNVVAVYAGNNVSNLVLLAASDDTPTVVGIRRQPHVYFTATNAATYRIAVAGATPADSGSIVLRVEPGGVPDTNAPVVTVTSPRSGLVTTSRLLTLTGTAADSGSGASGIAAVTVTVNRNPPVTALGTNNWTADILLAPGTNTIRVVAVDNAQNASVPVIIKVNHLVFDPPNDLFSLPIRLTNMADLLVVRTTNATAEAGEPMHAGKVGGKSIWFSFQPPSDGILDINTFNSTFDTLMGIYTGDRVFRASLVSSNDNAGPGLTYSQLSQPLLGGVNYRIAVDGLDGTAGFVQLQYVFTPAAVVNVVVSNVAGGVVTPPGNLYAANITTQFLAVPRPDHEFVIWQGSVDSLENPLQLTLNTNYILSPVFLPHEFSEDFESGNLSRRAWTNSGTSAWIVQTNEVAGGIYAARSAPIGNGGISSLILTAAFRDGPAGFNYRVSTEERSDFFSFLVDGVVQTNLSGETGWQRYNFQLPAGTHRLEWRYQKDGGFASNLDAVFLDNVDLPLVVPKTADTPAVLGRIGDSAGNPQLRVRGQTNQVYLIQASTDLSNWQTIGTNIAVHGYILFRDPQPAGLYNARYYRVLVP